MRLGGTRILCLGQEGASEKRGLLFYPCCFYGKGREKQIRVGNEESGYFWKQLRAQCSLSGRDEAFSLQGLERTLKKKERGEKEPSQGIFQDFGGWD